MIDASSTILFILLVLVITGGVFWLVFLSKKKASANELGPLVRKRSRNEIKTQEKSLESAQVSWDEVQRLLPDSFELASPHQKKLKEIKTPYVQTIVHGLASATPPLITALNSGKYLKIIGPPDALAQNLPFLKDKAGNILGEYLGPDGKIAFKARFEVASPSLNGAAAAACVFQFLSVATAQYYLHEITQSLQTIEKKADQILVKLESQQRGKALAALEIIKEVYSHNLRAIGRTGELDWSMPSKTEFWSRMSSAETSLRELIYSLESEITTKLQSIMSDVSTTDKNGDLVRVKDTVNERAEIINRMIDIYSHDLDVYRVALLGTMQWYQVVLAFDTKSNFSNLESRYNSMIQFIHNRNVFLREVCNTFNFVTTDAGTKFTVVDGFLVFSSPGGYIVREFILKPSRERKRQVLSKKINDVSVPYWESVMNLSKFEKSIESPRDFFLALDRGEKQTLTLLTAPDLRDDLATDALYVPSGGVST